MSGWVSWAETCRGRWIAGASSGEPPPSEPLQKEERDRVRVQKAASSTHRFLEDFRETQALPLTDANTWGSNCACPIHREDPAEHPSCDPTATWPSYRAGTGQAACTAQAKSPEATGPLGHHTEQRIPMDTTETLQAWAAAGSQSPLTAAQGARYWTELPGQCHLHQSGPL